MLEKLFGRFISKMNYNIVVYGWYHQGNIGDDLFVDAFRNLFPNYKFTFVTRFTSASLKDADAVFFGGGSFLYAKPNISDADLEVLKSKKIFYIGVGIEADVHPIHLDLMSKAKLIATRSNEQVDRIKKINPNTLFIPDIVYSLQEQVMAPTPIQKTVLVMPNISVVPKRDDAHWKYASWTYFKSEFSQFLDGLIADKYHINFLPLCNNRTLDDKAAAIEIINMMSYRNYHSIKEIPPANMAAISQILSQYSVIITQRFHGIVLAEMARVPYIAIHHHDKLKNSIPHEGKYVSYYGLNKQELIDQFNSTIKMKYSSVLPIESNIFKELQRSVDALLRDG